MVIKALLLNLVTVYTRTPTYPHKTHNTRTHYTHTHTERERERERERDRERVFYPLITIFFLFLQDHKLKMAIKDEYDALIENKTWDFVPRFANVNVITKFVNFQA